MSRGKRYYSGFSKMNNSELIHQKELWKEEKARNYLDTREDVSKALSDINFIIFMRWIIDNIGKIVLVSLFILALTLLSLG